MNWEIKFDVEALRMARQVLITSDHHGELMLYQTDLENEFKLVSGYCPHFGGPLRKVGNVLACYWHDYEFCALKLHILNKNGALKVKSFKIIHIDHSAGSLTYENF